ncbi:hypothetical protein BX616_008279, partial [Lobosporangium transversale]
MAAEKKPMQTKNKVLIAGISLIIVAGIAVGVYFGVHKNSSSSENKANESIGGGNGTPTTSAPPTSTTAVTPPDQKGTMINGTLFPYYNLTGEAPAPVGLPGVVYTTCKTPGTYSISYDDGPSE